jgi:hypothetical protein
MRLLATILELMSLDSACASLGLLKVPFRKPPILSRRLDVA